MCQLSFASACRIRYCASLIVRRPLDFEGPARLRFDHCG